MVYETLKEIKIMEMTQEERICLTNSADTEYVIFPLLKQRYSPRTFKEEKIEENELKQLFEAARWSASSFNIQPWRFIYTEKGSEAYDKIVDCLSDFNQKWASKAPVLMLAAYKEKKEEGQVNFHALHDLGLCLGNMTVQAQDMGIALHHMAGVDSKKAEKDFDIPQGFHVATAVAMGFYGGELDKLPKGLQEKETAQRKRMPQEDFAFKNSWED